MPNQHADRIQQDDIETVPAPLDDYLPSGADLIQMAMASPPRATDAFAQLKWITRIEQSICQQYDQAARRAFVTGGLAVLPLLEPINQPYLVSRMMVFGRLHHDLMVDIAIAARQQTRSFSSTDQLYAQQLRNLAAKALQAAAPSKNF